MADAYLETIDEIPSHLEVNRVIFKNIVTILSVLFIWIISATYTDNSYISRGLLCITITGGVYIHTKYCYELDILLNRLADKLYDYF